jgi:hypothetical protein
MNTLHSKTNTFIFRSGWYQIIVYFSHVFANNSLSFSYWYLMQVLVLKFAICASVWRKFPSIDSSPTSSKSKFFDKEMFNALLTMKDMVQELWKDREESIVLQEQLMAMKEEKDQLLEKLQEMENQLQEAKENLTKYMHNHEVCNVSLPSNSSQEDCFGVL